jgi:replication factor A2
MSHNIRLITDFNEITHHFLEVVYAHLYNTKGPIQGAPAPQKSPVKANNLGIGAGGSGAGVQGHRQQQPHQKQPQHQQSLPDQIFQILRQNANGESGVSVDDIQRILHDTATPDEIRATLEHLNNEALIYPTVDDNHYRLTE